MIAGVAVQVATMAICFLLAIDFGVALVRSKSISRKGYGGGEGLGGGHEEYSRTGRFRVYLVCTCLAFTTIFIRCIYR